MLSDIAGADPMIIPEYQNTVDEHKVHIVEQYSEMQEYWKEIEDLVEKLRLRKQERLRKVEEERRKS